MGNIVSSKDEGWDGGGSGRWIIPGNDEGKLPYPQPCWFTQERVRYHKAQQREIWDNYRGHPDLNRGPLDLQSNALPLSYTPYWKSVPPTGKVSLAPHNFSLW